MRWATMMAFAAFPLVVGALEPSNDWHICRSEMDCVLVEGPCGPTAVNRGYQSAAEAYYKEQTSKKSCKGQFWAGKANAVRCRIDTCEAVVNNKR